MIEFALLFTCFRKLGPGFRKLSAGPVDLPQEGEAMRPRSEVGSLHVAASDADGGDADGLGRGRASSDAVCL